MRHSKYDIPEPVIRRHPGPEERWTLCEDYHYRLDSGDFITIKAGFEYDGGSIPRLFWRVAHPQEFPAAFLVHDACYASELFIRLCCDKLLRRMIRREGGSKFQAAVIYAAVRLCGWLVWLRHKPHRVRIDRKYISLP